MKATSAEMLSNAINVPSAELRPLLRYVSAKTAAGGMAAAVLGDAANFLLMRREVGSAVRLAE
jgi:hypothetical protein